MKIAYVACGNLVKNSGVPKKFNYQVDAWRDAGAEVEFFCVTPDAGKPGLLMNGVLVHREESANPLKQWRNDRKAFGEMVERVKEWEPDLVYLRWGFHKPEYCEIARNFPTVIELNGDVLRTAILSGKCSKGPRRLLGRYTQLTLPWLLKEAAGFLAVTHEVGKLDYVKKWGKPVCVVPNSINLEEYSVLPAPKPENSKPRIALLANMAPWHGLDKVLDFADTVADVLDFDVIGTDGAGLKSQPNVHFHGYLERDEFLEVLGSCDVGLDGTALYRKQMDEACALKVREYLASGLPVMICANDTTFMDVDPDWLLKLGNFEGNLLENRDKIVEFCRRMAGNRVAHTQTSAYIHATDVEKARVEFFERIISENRSS